MNYCCEQMDYQLEPCSQHGNECPEKNIRLYPGGIYGMPIYDGSYQQIKVCPFCGNELQKWDHHDYEQIEPNAGNIKFAQDILELLSEKVYWYLDEIHRVKHGRGFNSQFKIDRAYLKDDKIHVKLRYQRMQNNLPDDEWEESFPASYLNDKNWIEQFKLDYINDKI